MRNKRSAFFAIALLSLILLASSCEKRLKIALSKGGARPGYERYSEWLKSFDKSIESVDLYEASPSEAKKILNECSALVLTGGPDVAPGRYGRASDSSRCEIDYRRDSLEFALIREALKKKMPILAICRGEQILNVAMGGSLIVDIPEDYDTIITHRCPDPNACFHKVKILPHTELAKITGVEIGLVNSNHHQAVDKLADVFVPAAYAPDGIIEAYEWKNPSDKSFLIAVQWHPERLDSNNLLSKPLALEFLKQAKKFAERN